MCQHLGAQGCAFFSEGEAMASWDCAASSDAFTSDTPIPELGCTQCAATEICCMQGKLRQMVTDSSRNAECSALAQQVWSYSSDCRSPI